MHGVCPVASSIIASCYRFVSPIAKFSPSLDLDRHLFDVSLRSRIGLRRDGGGDDAGMGRGGDGVRRTGR